MPKSRRIPNQAKWPKVLIIGKTFLQNEPNLQLPFLLPAILVKLYPQIAHASEAIFSPPENPLPPINILKNLDLSSKSRKRPKVPSADDLQHSVNFVNERSIPEESIIIEEEEEIISAHQAMLKAIEINQHKLEIMKLEMEKLQLETERSTRLLHENLSKLAKLQAKHGKLKVVVFL